MALRAEDIDLARDRHLVEAWQAGDTAALDDLYQRYFDRLRAFCHRRVGNAAEAEEIAQEAFVKALQALPRFSGERRFYPWLTVIASRLCIDHHRRRQRVEPSDDVDLGSVDDGHDARVTLQTDLDHLDRAMRRLGPRHVEVLDLRERQGLSYHEIAGELGVPHSTVETLLFRARKALRREFQVVSAERLVALPGIGWVLGRGVRLRHRLLLSPDLPALGGALAAGAIAAALVTLPGAGPGQAPASVRTADRPAPAVAPPAPAPAPATTSLRVPAGVPATPTSGEPAPSVPPAAEPAPAPALTPRVRQTSGADARDTAATMPIQLDAEGNGLGLDLAPITDRLQTTLSGGTNP